MAQDHCTLRVLFFDLHVAIQDAFGWGDCHLHQFFIESPFKRDSRYRRIAYPMPEMEDVIDERKAKLTDWLQAPKSVLWYEYDFGDSWMHEIKLEKILPSEQRATYPHLLGGVRACPPEDCGGIGGYRHLLEVLANPRHTDHADMLDWLSIDRAEDFDPEQFDSGRVKFRDPKKVLKEFEKQFR